MRCGYNSSLGMPERLTSEKLLKYYWFLRHSAVERNRQIASVKIVLSHIGLGMSIVGRMYFGTLSSDVCVSEMLWSLVHGVELMRDGALDHHGEFPNITGYLVTTVQGYLRRLRFQEQLINTRYAKGKKIIIQELNGHEVEDRKGEANDLLDFILTQTKTSDEFEVVKLRSVGFTDCEIGQKLNLHQSTVSRIRSEIYERVRHEIS